MSEVLAIIPARSGSKSVKDKNIRSMAGKPMIAYSIEHALQASSINRVIVSTDSKEYAEIAKSYGAEVPFLRPEELAGDLSLDIETFEHALCYLKENEGYVPDIVVQLRPTYPIRDVMDIDKMVALLENDASVDSVRCIVPAKEIAYKMWNRNVDGTISPILNGIKEAYNMPRQQLPLIYYQNACIDVVRSTVITTLHSMSGDKILGYEMKHNFDIDTEDDFKQAEEYIMMNNGKKKFVFDIDGVITLPNPSLKYDESYPNKDIITIINKLYEQGNQIVLFTARGFKTGIDWEQTTIEQMRRWNVKYHELRMGKPDADYYVDDKAMLPETLQRLFSN